MNVNDMQAVSSTIQGMSDGFFNKVEEDHGKDMRTAVEAAVSAKMFITALAKVLVAADADEDLTQMVGLIGSKYAATCMATICDLSEIDHDEDTAAKIAELADEFMKKVDQLSDIFLTPTSGVH